MHLLGGQINAVALATSAHGESGVELGELGIEVLFGDDAELNRSIKNVVVCKGTRLDG